MGLKHAVNSCYDQLYSDLNCLQVGLFVKMIKHQNSWSRNDKLMHTVHKSCGIVTILCMSEPLYIALTIGVRVHLMVQKQTVQIC